MAYECAKPELMFFDPKGVQYSIISTEELLFRPLASIENSNIIQFGSHGESNDYRNLASTYIIFKVRLNHKTDGTDTTKPEDEKEALSQSNMKVSCVNNLLHSLFRQVTLTLNGRQIAQNNMNYSYRSYIENVLNYSIESSQLHLDTIIWEMDTEGKFDSFDGNTGLKKRGMMLQRGEEVELIGRLHLDMFNTTKLLLNNVNFLLTFEMNRPEFYLMKKDAKNTSNLEILDASLYMEHVKLNPEVMLSHNKLMEDKMAMYNFKRVDVRNILIPSSSTSLSMDNVYNGPLPELMIIGFVETDAYNGNVLKNPFNFQHFNLTSFRASVNGYEITPHNLTFDFEKKNPQSQRAYFQLFKQLNFHKFDRSNQITRELYNGGMFLLAYDLTPDRGVDCANILQGGTIRLTGNFAKPLSNSVTAIIYMQFDADIGIDKERAVFTQLA